MGVFGNEDYVDYTLLKKRGLLKESNQEVKNENSNSGFVDYNSVSANSSANNVPSSPSTNPFDLLSSLTSGSAVSNSGSIYSDASVSSSDENVKALKLKIEDLEYKL